MNSGLADFIEQNTEAIIEHAVDFARSVDVGKPLDDPRKSRSPRVVRSR